MTSFTRNPNTKNTKNTKNIIHSSFCDPLRSLAGLSSLAKASTSLLIAHCFYSVKYKRAGERLLYPNAQVMNISLCCLLSIAVSLCPNNRQI